MFYLTSLLAHLTIKLAHLSFSLAHMNTVLAQHWPLDQQLSHLTQIFSSQLNRSKGPTEVENN